MLSLARNLAPVSQNTRILVAFYCQKAPPPEAWEPIYKFPYVKSAYALCKLKNYQYVITTVSIPVTYTFEYFGLVDPGIGGIVTAMGITGSVSLTLAALLCKNLVGLLYVNAAKDKLRIGYLTFWGRREDRVVDITDVKPFTETQRFRIQPVSVLATYGDRRRYKVVDMAGVLRRDDYELVFGKD